MSATKYDFDALQHDPEAVLSKMTDDEVGGLLDYAADAYYIQGKPVVSDDLYDLVYDYLKKKNPHHPAVQRVGAPIQEGKKVELPYYMGSLDKIRDDPKALTKWLGTYDDPPRCMVSDKLDGNSGLLVYDKKSVGLYSRGDGVFGQNVSHLLDKIEGIVPIDKLRGKTGFTLPLAIRGELIISRKKWEQVKELGANARNVVAGAMHASSPDPRIASRIDFVAYELLEPRMAPLEGMRLLEKLGFMTAYYEPIQNRDMSMDKLSEVLVSRRKNSPYEVDGIVIAHDKEHKRLRDRNPRHVFAFKSLLTHDEAEVVVTKVEWNVSKDGYIKPLVHFPPVIIEGAKIAKATGFNAAFIEQHKIGPGSRIIVIRSGAVIPHILRVVSASSNGKPAFPNVRFRWTDTHVDIVMEKGSGEEEDPAIVKKRMEFFVKTLDIKNVGPGTIEKLFNSGLDTIPKLLAAKKEDIMRVEGFQSTSAQNIVDGLAAVKKARCADLMAASGLFGRGMGVKKMAPVLAAFPRIAEPEGPLPSYEELRGVPGMGEVSAKSVLEGIAPFRAFLKEIGHGCQVAAAPRAPRVSSPGRAGPSAAAPAVAAASAAPLAGVTAVFTGFRNKGWEGIIADAGGKVSTSVSKNTTVVVAADPNEDSSKLTKARELGVPIITKEAFAKKYGLTL